MSELSPEQACEKCHKHLVAGLRLIRPTERVTAIAEAMREVGREKNADAIARSRTLGNNGPAELFTANLPWPRAFRQSRAVLIFELSLGAVGHLARTTPLSHGAGAHLREI
jgi:hypothetical protein